ncbi:MAG: hypothetical protein FJZ95_08535, partial [Chloroflexi bacterium]|nr:hypothetical protein [Chloroflexota bacterium]
PGIGASRWLASGKSPATDPEHFSHCNLGGRWGVDLKAAGYDALMITGRAEKPVYLFLHDGEWELRDANGLRGKGAIRTRRLLKVELGEGISVLAIGPAGENGATMASLTAEDDSSGSGGLAAVMGSKNLKAIVVPKGRLKIQIAYPDHFKELTARYRALGKEPIVAVAGVPMRIMGPNTRPTPCPYCAFDCIRRSYTPTEGEPGKFMCQSAIFYRPMAEAIYGPQSDIPFRATKLCDDYGLDTMALSLIMVWLWRCAKAGILTDQNTGIPLSKFGTIEFLETLVRKISFREGFGDLLAQGVHRAAESVGGPAVAQLTPLTSKAGQENTYDSRLYLNTALLHATEPRPPTPQLQEISRVIFKWLEWRREEAGTFVSGEVARRIAKRFWGSELAADFTTFEGKALAAKMIQDREYAKECLVLCSFVWPVMEARFTPDHVGDPSLEAQVLSAVMGEELDEASLNRIGERVFNLQRAILLREGHRGAADDSLPESWFSVPAKWDMPNPKLEVPGPGGEAVSRKGATVDRAAFERTKAEYYELRGWVPLTGLPAPGILRSLGLEDVAEDLEKRGIIS